MNTSDLIQLLYDQIPTAKFMGLKAHSLNENQVTLSCPLKPNHNHLGTAFGGSLSTLLILAAYSMTYKMIEGKGHVLIKSSEVKYNLPVQEEIISVCLAPEESQRKKFLETFNRRGKAKITLKSYILLKDGTKACSMSAEMVAIS